MHGCPWPYVILSNQFPLYTRQRLSFIEFLYPTPKQSKYDKKIKKESVLKSKSTVQRRVKRLDADVHTSVNYRAR